MNNHIRNFFFLFLLLSHSVSAGIYKWTDSDGNIHFGDQPVNNPAATELQIKINKHSGITNLSSNKKDREYLLERIEKDKQKKAEKRVERLAYNKKRKNLCNRYKMHYQNQIQSNKLYTMTPDGERTYLSNKELDARKKKLNKGISKYC